MVLGDIQTAKKVKLILTIVLIVIAIALVGLAIFMLRKGAK